uniref:hypothetical protein n=1 Tax=uncultured Caulobacter sp. TaxID=158749 RepID=UPI0025FC9F23|nr:hypothetical protein [uncultured Caulobacter sp.]
MAKSFEEVLFADTGLHQLRLPRTGVKVFDVQAQDNGRPVGAYTLADLLDGDFGGLTTSDVSDLADLNRTVSRDYNLDAKGGVGGLAGLVAKAKGALAAKGARQVAFRWVEGQLVQADQGGLDRAILKSKIRPDGPLARGLAGVVITAVASTTRYTIQLVDADGGSVSAQADAADAVSAELGAKVEVSKSGGLEVTHPTPVVFAVRCIVLQPKTFGGGLRIVYPKGPRELMGETPGQDLHAEYVAVTGVAGDTLDFR